ncbi:MAG: hypothetical protein KF812_11695 [Fimbriimonadaceae bacterium]|nr:hypothetical protein [Fimbriimonadaceae bacterium]
MAIITCPGCGQQVPDFNPNCQFCGVLLSGNPQVTVKKTIECPNCEMILKDTTEICPGCGTNVMHLARDTRSTIGFTYHGKIPPFAWPMYYLISAYWTVSGLYGTVSPFLFGQGFTICIIFPILQVLMGIGLLLRIEAVRGIVNILCWFSILGGILGAIGSIISIPATGVFGVIAVIGYVLTIVTSALMIWVIGLTQANIRD